MNGLSFNDYQFLARDTAIYPDVGNNIRYPTLGLCEEAGEIAGQIKRIHRDDFGQITKERRMKLMRESGDVLWYVAMLAHEINICLDDIANDGLGGIPYGDKTIAEFHARVRAEFEYPIGEPVIDMFGMKLVEAAGVIAGLTRTMIVSRDGTTITNNAIYMFKTLGKVLISLTLLADYLQVNIAHVADMNIDNLQRRKEKGALHGEGSDR